LTIFPEKGYNKDKSSRQEDKKLRNRIPTILTYLWGVLLSAQTLALPAFAANPLTGDERGSLLTFIIPLLIISLVLIIVFAVMSAKKGKGGQGPKPPKEKKVKEKKPKNKKPKE